MSKRKPYAPRDRQRYHDRKHAADWLRGLAQRLGNSPKGVRYKLVVKVSAWDSNPAAEVVGAIGYEVEPRP